MNFLDETLLRAQQALTIYVCLVEKVPPVLFQTVENTIFHYENHGKSSWTQLGCLRMGFLIHNQGWRPNRRVVCVFAKGFERQEIYADQAQGSPGQYNLPLNWAFQLGSQKKATRIPTPQENHLIQKSSETSFFHDPKRKKKKKRLPNRPSQRPHKRDDPSITGS